VIIKPGQNSIFRNYKIIFFIFALILAVIYLVNALHSHEKQPTDKPDDPYLKARLRMVSSQIEQRGVTDKNILEAMRRIPRHLFIPEKYRSHAYDDGPMPIGEGQTISQPYIVALMTWLIKPDEGDKILEIGTGSGYQAAVLAELAGEVYTIEIVEVLGHRAKALLDNLEYKNIDFRIGDGYQGWPEQAPFDGIIVTCAPPEVPQPLLDQLAEGGLMIIPVGVDYQELVLFEKKDGEIIKRSVLPVRFVPMTGDGVKK